MMLREAFTTTIATRGRDEWAEVFDETWRIFRDYFYVLTVASLPVAGMVWLAAFLLSVPLGFTIALVMMGGFREILGVGAFFDIPLFGPNFEPWVVMVLPAGGFLTLGFIILAMGYVAQRKQARKAGEEATA